MDRCFAQIVIEENQTDNKCGVDTLYQLASPKPYILVSNFFNFYSIIIDSDSSIMWRIYNMGKTHLEKVNWDNYRDVLRLSVAKEQENFVASNEFSLIHAYLAICDDDIVYTFAIYNDDTVVGFISIGYDNDWSGEEREDWLNSDIYKEYEGINYYYIWRFMIDEKYQGKGYGREAFKQALDFIKSRPCGDAEYVTLSYERANEVAKNLYFSFGFYEPKEFEPYYEEEDEIRAILKI